MAKKGSNIVGKDLLFFNFSDKISYRSGSNNSLFNSTNANIEASA